MNDISSLCISSSTPIILAIRTIDTTGRKIALVTDNQKLVGVVTDGDVRRWIIKNGSLDMSVSNIMCKAPKFVYQGIDAETEAKNIMYQLTLEAIPVLNKEHVPVDIIFLNNSFNDDLLKQEKINSPVVIMAGGKGTRLFPYTKVLPKPLIPIGDTTILERIINSFRSYGCNDFWLTINYKKGLIKAYFDDICPNFSLKFIEEEQFLGTGGSLFYLKDKINESFFVSNCDILLDVDYAKVMKFHKDNKHDITVVTSLKNFQIPYGVTKIDNNGFIIEMTEKPEFNFQINTGIYVLEPSVLEVIPHNTFYNITELIDTYVSKNKRVGTYPVTEGCWSDMGELGEMDKMINMIGNR